MHVNGIIAEYNPFHNGHKYLLAEAKRSTNADYTIIVMSGNFMQRGTPAIINKYKRAEMALKNGADLVLYHSSGCPGHLNHLSSSFQHEGFVRIYQSMFSEP